MRIEDEKHDERLRRSVARHAYHAPLIPVMALGLASSLFFSISFVLCALGYVLIPSMPVSHTALAALLPGFESLTLRSFFYGLVESFGWGWYISLVFGPLYNFFAARVRAPSG